VAVIIWVAGCVAAARWQVDVAMSGNSLGWLYAVEWPIFAVFGVIFWWQLVHDDPATVGSKGLRRATRVSGTEAVERGRGLRRVEEEDAELAEYNEYLAKLAASGRAKTIRNPTGRSRT
jgi:hypothetical protein